MFPATIRRQAGGGERVFEQGQQGQRRVIRDGGARQQAQQHGGGGLFQRLAGAVIGGDAEAFQRGGDARGEAAIRRDQGGRAAGDFQRFAQDHGDRGGVLRLVLRFEFAQARRFQA